MRNILLNWKMGNFSGWGILGLNLFAQWANLPYIRPIMGYPIDPYDLPMVDPLRLICLRNAFGEANNYLARLQPDSRGQRKLKGTVIDGLGSDLAGGAFFGDANIGRCVFEDTTLGNAREKLARYDQLLCGSNWNAGLLEAKTGRRPKVIFEGVDTSIFCPGPRSGIFDASKFYIFSGGKIEHRKGQDVTLLAFREFSRRHEDAVLVTAWHSLWPQSVVGYKGRLDHPVQLDAQGQFDIRRWVHENGIDPARVLDLRPIPNALMPVVLREMDVCVQPSRAEACTNLLAKEAMACAVPVIVTANTGMLDLVADGNCVPLTRQTPVVDYPAMGTEGWGEPDVDELLEALEWAYRNRSAAKAIGVAGSQWLTEQGRTWSAHAKQVLEWVMAA
ncbi:glycosyltransferase family 4 protein [Trinickia terrae]|uniref:Glycosyltransferase family 4 protein n=1 Tax=Trinickia terrae TaxID=2571161 RepID=A0A4U1HWA7_9BURK|nr:glycosyltransferase family 4 protein [Trinickia terrae]TKC85979.1 glycosyltransferase family 4 protein [Trinickia terrae]